MCFGVLLRMKFASEGFIVSNGVRVDEGICTQKGSTGGVNCWADCIHTLLWHWPNEPAIAAYSLGTQLTSSCLGTRVNRIIAPSPFFPSAPRFHCPAGVCRSEGVPRVEVDIKRRQIGFFVACRTFVRAVWCRADVSVECRWEMERKLTNWRCYEVASYVHEMLSHCGDRRVHVGNLPGFIIYLLHSGQVVTHSYLYVHSEGHRCTPTPDCV